MIPPQYENLLGKLEVATSKLSGIWKPTSDRDKFSIRINNTTILLNSYVSFPEEYECVSLEIMNAGGEIIDGMYLSTNELGYIRLKNLYDTARRNALKIPETLSDLVSGLDQLLVNNGISENSDSDVDELPF